MFNELAIFKLSGKYLKIQQKLSYCCKCKEIRKKLLYFNINNPPIKVEINARTANISQIIHIYKE